MPGSDHATPSRRWSPVRWLREHPGWADALLCAGLMALSLPLHLADYDPTDAHRSPTWWTTLLLIATLLPIAWRRRYPNGSAAVIVSAFVIAGVAEVNGVGFLGVVVAVYSLGAHSEGSGRARTVGVIAVAIGALLIIGMLASEVDVGAFVSSTIVLITAFVLGDNVRRRRHAAQQLQERLERAERERDLMSQQRVSEERSRIARELHDVVAHSVTGMVIQAAAARRSMERSPAAAAEALDNIEQTGRRTMNELRTVLGVLRDDSSDSSESRMPQPGLAHLDALIDASSDLPVELYVDGVELSTLGTAAPSIDLAAYRLIQEALTNVRRHAGGVERVVVEIGRDGGELVVTVTDDGRTTTPTSSESPGYGLVGMAERVGAVGGTLRAGPWGPRGWRLSAHLPLAERDPRVEPSVSR